VATAVRPRWRTAGRGARVVGAFTTAEDMVLPHVTQARVSDRSIERCRRSINVCLNSSTSGRGWHRHSFGLGVPAGEDAQKAGNRAGRGGRSERMRRTSSDGGRRTCTGYDDLSRGEDGRSICAGGPFIMQAGSMIRRDQAGYEAATTASVTVAHQQMACQASPLPITPGSQICVVRAKARRRSQGQLHMLMNRCQAHIMQVLCIPSHVAGGVGACTALICMILPCTILTCTRPSSPVSISSDGVVRRLAYLIGVGSASRPDLRAWPRQIDADRRTMYPALQF